MTPANFPGQFGDTTYTKVFVGGLAWETQKETMKKYFEQFGEILEAVVITDKNTGKSKGYGFVTFRDPEAAMKACVDAAPVIDGRRTNCNLASLGVQRSRPSTPKHEIKRGENEKVSVCVWTDGQEGTKAIRPVVGWEQQLFHQQPSTLIMPSSKGFPTMFMGKLLFYVSAYVFSLFTRLRLCNGLYTLPPLQ
ncbi:hypothetical protein ACLOJK_016900 [Asimina triloba]